MLKAWIRNLKFGRADAAERLIAARRLQSAGKTVEAMEICDRVIADYPGHADALLLAARFDAQAGRLAAARNRLEAVLASDPGRADAHADLGNVLQLAGDLEAAGEMYETALAFDPAMPVAWNNFGLNCLARGEAEAAAAAFGEALARAPGFEDALRNLVSTNMKLGHHANTRSHLEAELERNPGNGAAHAALGFVMLKGLGEPALALEHFEQARAAGLASAELLTNRGIALHDLGRMEEAIASYDSALTADPEYQLARFHRALARLIGQRFDLAWDDYEARLLSEVLPPRKFGFPQWNAQDLAGKTLLILAEQGLGDEIMFASCFAEAISRAQHCVIDCAVKLAPIFQRSFPKATVRGGSQFDDPAWLADLPQPDYQIHAGSLPRILRPALSAFPRHRGYLAADPSKVEKWRGRLAALGSGLKVGVSWRGGTALSRSSLRSLKLDDLAPVLAVPGASFVSLQYDAGREEVTSYCARSGQALEYFEDAIEDYDETAALVASLDLVISVCTAVIHLGGALATPVWVMAPRVPEWRYGIAGETMPWYPANRVLRQAMSGEWDSVIARAAAELARLCA